MNTTKTRPALLAVIDCVSSLRDRAGNCYFAFTFTNCETGKGYSGTVSGGESNVKQIIFELCGQSWTGADAYHFTWNALPIRQYERMTKGWPYAGCLGEEIVKRIREAGAL
jgi:hypothetical protein